MTAVAAVELLGAGRAVGQAGVGLARGLELPDELDRAGQGFFLVVDGAIEVEQDSLESIQVRVHAGAVYWRAGELKGGRA